MKNRFLQHCFCLEFWGLLFVDRHRRRDKWMSRRKKEWSGLQMPNWAYLFIGEFIR